MRKVLKTKSGFIIVFRTVVFWRCFTKKSKKFPSAYSAVRKISGTQICAVHRISTTQLCGSQKLNNTNLCCLHTNFFFLLERPILELFGFGNTCPTSTVVGLVRGDNPNHSFCHFRIMVSCSYQTNRVVCEIFVANSKSLTSWYFQQK